jgi:hypothetical protein
LSIGTQQHLLKGYHAYELGYYWYYLILRAIRTQPLHDSRIFERRFSDEPEQLIKPYVRHLQNYKLKRTLKK